MKQILKLFMITALILGTHQGYLALIENNEPLEIYPYHIKMLPHADQEHLRKGIPIKDETHLEKLLQDYLS
jgi:hypothetical protein